MDLKIVDDEKAGKPMDYDKFTKLFEDAAPKIKSRINEAKVVIIPGTIYNKESKLWTIADSMKVNTGLSSMTANSSYSKEA